MKKIMIIVFACLAINTFAQQNILKQIEENNTLLSSLRAQTEAEKIGNKTGMLPDNPEVEYGYLWGNEKEMGNRIDFSVSQSFDFPTAYYHRKKLTDTQNQQADIKYLIERKNILLEAQNVCIELTYQSALSVELKKQLELTSKVMDAYQRKFELGEASSLDFNKARFDLMNAQKDYNASVIEKEFLIAELQRLNGGNEVDYLTSEFSEVSLPLNFDQWFTEQKARNLSLSYFEKEVKISKQNESLQRSLNLPKISAGYMSEKVMSEHFQGITVGVSIPLWENKNTIKQIKAQTLSNQQQEADANLQYYHQMNALYKKAVNQKQIVDDFNRYQVSDNTVNLLTKALEKGEMPLIEFIVELGVYYELIQSKLETERDLNLSIAELRQWEL